MIRAIITLPHRGADMAGAGHYGAPRGVRRHNGVDYAAEPGTAILAPVFGVVTKLGYPYADDPSYRYVEITDPKGTQHRIFYVQPCVSPQHDVTVDTVIGHAQNISARKDYGLRGMINHVHYEVRTAQGVFVDPENQP